jgi:sulfite exporter TauE/SafE
MPATPPLLLAALLTGLLGGSHCVLMCGGFACGAQRSVVSGVLYHTGRLYTYAWLGLLGGGIGGWIGGWGWLGSAVVLALTAWLALRMAGWQPPRAWSRLVHGRLHRLTRLVDRGGPFVLGMTTALLPCGLVYAALALPMVSGSPLQGALLMVVFGLGTLPWLAAWAWGAGRAGRLHLTTRRWVALAIFAAGLWSTLVRSQWQPAPDGVDPARFSTDCHALPADP